MTSQDNTEYLKTLKSIRETCYKVYELAEQDKLEYWRVDLSKQDDIVNFVCQLIERDYGTDYDSIPPHGRWRHFGNRLDLNKWRDVSTMEVARMMIDLMVVSVLMDAGAGDKWKYTSKGESIGRSEGLAVGSLEMFEAGFFGAPCKVTAEGLAKITPEQVAEAMQVTPENPMTGIEGRAQLLIKLGNVLDQEYFKGRPGNMVDFLMERSRQVPSPNSYKVAVDVNLLWEVVIDGLAGVWPRADVWELRGEKVSFHKLSQWMTYSLVEVIEVVLGWKVIGKEVLTGLPEYRNGGLLIDFGLLTPKADLTVLEPSHPAVVEMRAVTVIMLDKLAEGIRKKVGDLTLPQVLEAGTWKAGREIAKQKRQGGGPPFQYVADGTVF